MQFGLRRATPFVSSPTHLFVLKRPISHGVSVQGLTFQSNVWLFRHENTKNRWLKTTQPWIFFTCSVREKWLDMWAKWIIFIRSDHFERVKEYVLQQTCMHTYAPVNIHRHSKCRRLTGLGRGNQTACHCVLCITIILSHSIVTGVVRATPQVNERRQSYPSRHTHTP